MKHIIKRIISSILVLAMLVPATVSMSVSAQTNAVPVGMGVGNVEIAENRKVSDELLDKLEVTASDFQSGNYPVSGDKISCIIWIDDIDMEVPVKAGIDAAEKTKPLSLQKKNLSEFAYPYEVFYLNGYKIVDVNLSDSADDTYVKTYMETERSVAASLYSQNNSDFVEENIEMQGVSVEYVSKYSPCIFAYLSIDEIADLSEIERVQRIGYWDDSLGTDEVSSDSFTSAELSDLNTHLSIIRADTAKSTYDVSGSGIRIGQIESGVPEDAIQINSDSITEHANQVYTIMHTVAPDATYYATTTGGVNVTYYNNIEVLISRGVNIINQSNGWSNALNTYDERSRWIDHITYNHDVHFVKSAGNEGAKGVTSPGMAYNIITVGNANRTSPYNLHNTSSYNKNGAMKNSNLTVKPDIVAPGTYSSGLYGTSLATPLVTGTIALMCEYQPALKTKQHIVKAILAAAASKEKRYETEESAFKQYGAGLLDAHAAIWTIYRGNYSSTTGALSSVSASRTYNMPVTPSDTSMRVALAYANRIKFSTNSAHPISTPPSGTIGELKLEVFAPNGSLVSSCTTSGANLKIVQFTPPMTGTYQIKVTLTSLSSNGTTNFGVSWR